MAVDVDDRPEDDPPRDPALGCALWAVAAAFVFVVVLWLLLTLVPLHR